MEEALRVTASVRNLAVKLPSGTLYKRRDSRGAARRPRHLSQGLHAHERKTSPHFTFLLSRFSAWVGGGRTCCAGCSCRRLGQARLLRAPSPARPAGARAPRCSKPPARADSFAACRPFCHRLSSARHSVAALHTHHPPDGTPDGRASSRPLPSKAQRVSALATGRQSRRGVLSTGRV